MIPTRAEFKEIIERARLAGQEAAKKRYEELQAKANPQDQLIDFAEDQS